VISTSISVHLLVIINDKIHGTCIKVIFMMILTKNVIIRI